jgi:hypothetical protein
MRTTRVLPQSQPVLFSVTGCLLPALVPQVLDDAGSCRRAGCVYFLQYPNPPNKRRTLRTHARVQLYLTQLLSNTIDGFCTRFGGVLLNFQQVANFGSTCVC